MLAHFLKSTQAKNVAHKHAHKLKSKQTCDRDMYNFGRDGTITDYK